jgi:predicted phosphohydrolase
MRILVTADLHYNIPRSQGPAERLARRVAEAQGDVLVLLGDTAGARLEPMREALRLFADFRGRKLLVPGNHCLWCRSGEDSLDRYNKVLPALAEEEGFVVLDHHPQLINGLGLAGSIGWYDYSFRDRKLDVPVEFYREKLSPGAAAYLGRDDLVEAHRGKLKQRHMSLGVRWRDGQFVRLPMSDAQFVAMLAQRLREQLQALADRAQRIAVFLHHLPFQDLVPVDRPDRFAFAAAFLGSEALGRVISECDKVTHVYCGHSHWPSRIRRGSIEVVNVGSTYVEKKLEILEL